MEWGLLLTIAGVIVGVVSAVAAVFAAVYGFRAVRAARAAADLADHRWMNLIHPRPRVRFVAQGGAAGVSRETSTHYTQTIEVDNPGGAFVDGFVVLRVNDTLYSGVLSLPGQTRKACHIVIRRGPSPYASIGACVALVYARDIDGCWWDAIADVKIRTNTPPESSNTPAFQAWIDRRLALLPWPNDDTTASGCANE